MNFDDMSPAAVDTSDPCPSCDRPGIPGRPACDGCHGFTPKAERASTPEAVDVVMDGEPTITINDKAYTPADIVANAFDEAIATALLTAEGVKKTVARTIKASRHNADLLEALEDGSEFRIAFKKPGINGWTRIMIEEEDALRAAAIEEINQRQSCVMVDLAAILGVETFSIDNI